jgi:hypothetical protein
MVQQDRLAKFCHWQGGAFLVEQEGGSRRLLDGYAEAAGCKLEVK